MDPITFEDWLAMSAGAAAWGLPTMLATYRVSETQWSAWSSHWNAKLPGDPRGAHAHAAVAQETARLRAGGPPRPLGGQQAAPNLFGGPHEQAAFERQAAQAGDQLGSALSSFGSALGSMFTNAVLTPGASVLVAWSDGNRYPAQVTAMGQGQVEVAFPDGRRMWVPQAYVSVAL